MVDNPLSQPTPSPKFTLEQAETLRPHFARHGVFVPVEKGRLMVSLTNETAQSEVLSVISHDTAVVKLKGPLMNNVGHTFKTGDVIAVERSGNEMGVEIWVPIDERKVNEQQRAEELAREVAIRRLEEGA